MGPEAASTVQQVDFSLIALFIRATITVKIVMLILLLSSIWSWSIIIQKFFDYSRAKRETKYFQDAFWSGESLDELFERLGYEPRGDSEKVFVAGMTEWRRSHRPDGELITGAQARIDRSMNVALTKASDKMNSGLYFLATVGSTAPFVGLFGTVWGIKNAFEEIALQQSTNLAVVAPGIAEALLATALGLLAAIPAVVAYNKFNSDSKRYVSKLDNFSKRFLSII